MANICLIQPRNITFGSDNSSKLVFPPLGLGYLAAYVRSQRPNDNIHIIDCLIEGQDYVEKQGNYIITGLPDKLLIERLRPLESDIIGISTVGSQSHQIYVNTAKNLQREYRGVPIFFGGAHATAAPEKLLKECPDVGIVNGEGEITFTEIVNAVDNQEDWHAINGISFCNNGNIIKTPQRPLYKEIDMLPFPAVDLFPLNLYFENQRKWTGFYTLPALSVLTSRGCPMNCAHCAFTKVWGQRAWRPRSAENVVNEIEYLYKELGIREIHFMDDNLSYDPKRLEAICDLLLKRDINIRWTTPNGLAYWTLEPELLKKMRRSGCYRIALGLESGSPETMAFIGKPFNPNKVRSVVRSAKNAGLWTTGYFMIGFPYETKEQMEQTLKYAIELDLDFAAFNLVTPFPGTRLEEIAIKEGLFDPDKISGIWGYGMDTVFFTREQVRKIVHDVYVEFYRIKLRKLRPKTFFSRINESKDVGYVLDMVKNYGKLYHAWFLRPSELITK